MYAPSPSYNMQFILHIKLHFLQCHSGVDIVYCLTRKEGGGVSLENMSNKYKWVVTFLENALIYEV